MDGAHVGGAAAGRIPLRQGRRAAASRRGRGSRRLEHKWSARGDLGQRSRRRVDTGWRALVADDGGEDNRTRGGARSRREQHVARRRCSKRAHRAADAMSSRGCKCEKQEQHSRCPRAGLTDLAVQVREREHDPSAHGASRDAQDGRDLSVRPPLEKRHVQHLAVGSGERRKAGLNRVAMQGCEQAIPDARLAGSRSAVLGQEPSCLGVAPKPPSRIRGPAWARALTFGLDHAAHRALTLEARLPRRNRQLITSSRVFHRRPDRRHHPSGLRVWGRKQRLAVMAYAAGVDINRRAAVWTLI
jgi:hypothetical protein